MIIRALLKNCHNETTLAEHVSHRLFPNHDAIIAFSEEEYIVKNQTWIPQAGMSIGSIRRSTVITPDVSHGFHKKLFVSFPRATEFLGPAMCPLGPSVPIMFPFSTTELKGKTGNPGPKREKGMLQNSNNALSMLNNFLHLQEAAGQVVGHTCEPMYLVLTTFVTPKEIELYVNWLSTSPTGDCRRSITYHSCLVKSWKLPEEFFEASDGLMNAIDYIRKGVQALVFRDVSSVEDALERTIT